MFIYIRGFGRTMPSKERGCAPLLSSPPSKNHLCKALALSKSPNWWVISKPKGFVDQVNSQAPGSWLFTHFLICKLCSPSPRGKDELLGTYVDQCETTRLKPVSMVNSPSQTLQPLGVPGQSQKHNWTWKKIISK